VAVGETPAGTVIDPHTQPDAVIIKIGVNNR
jgi:hypothetical protein